MVVEGLIANTSGAENRKKNNGKETEVREKKKTTLEGLEKEPSSTSKSPC